MNRFILACSVLAISSTTFAQAFYSPVAKYETYSGYDIATGDYGYEYYFARYSQGRYQLGDGNFHNVMPLLSKVSYRPSSGYSYYSYYGTGRTWANVTLDMSNTTIAQMKGATGSTWSANQTSSPVRVFSTSVTWKTVDGLLGAKAITDWGSYAFAFTTPWVRATAAPAGLDSDIMCDYQFSGGTMANNALWSSTSIRYYRLDGYAIKSYANGPQVFYHDNTTSGCVDSRARPPFTRAYTYMYCSVYGGGYPTVSFKNMFRFYMYGYNMAPMHPYVARVGVSVNAAGLAYGAGCEKLYISGPPLNFPGTTNTYGSTGTNYFGLTNGLLPINPAFFGLNVITQATWSDSSTSAAMISAACSAKIIPLDGIESIDAARRHCRMFYSGTGLATYSYAYNYANPICKYN